MNELLKLRRAWYVIFALQVSMNTISLTGAWLHRGSVAGFIWAFITGWCVWETKNVLKQKAELEKTIERLSK